ncbi:hypothetical protein [Clostridium estertheticum]|uniref:hypothetical protein n=1 Tax=Clostridium estertheticum TaxID=238834 RepID=UPI001C0B4E1F|nr:hypothetical protein [Clostridium estertheticum]MBU3173367.1 hypothetical protein [Clostridium estertheticum]
MMNNEVIVLTEEDKKIIDKLKISPILKMANIARKVKIENILSIDDLSDSELNYILPKIDVYIAEQHEFRANLGSFDEVWMFDYSALQDKIKYRLGIK